METLLLCPSVCASSLPLCHLLPQTYNKHTLSEKKKKLTLEHSGIWWVYYILSIPYWCGRGNFLLKNSLLPTSVSMVWEASWFHLQVQREECDSYLTNHNIQSSWPQRLVQGWEYDPIRPKQGSIIIEAFCQKYHNRGIFSFLLNLQLLGHKPGTAGWSFYFSNVWSHWKWNQYIAKQCGRMEKNPF